MKLVVTVPWNERLGGAENMLWTFLQTMDSDAIDATVVFFDDGPFQREVAALPGVQTAVVPVGRIRQVETTLRATTRIAHLLRRTKPDLILNWTATSQVYGAIAARMAGMQDSVVWWQHAIPRGHRIERAATLFPSCAIGCSSAAAARAQAAMWPRRKVFVVNPGTEPRDVEPVRREELGIPGERTVIGIVGRLQPWKGQHRFLRALARLRDRGHDVHGLIVGGDAYGFSPEYAPFLDGLIDELSLRDCVTMTGHIDDPLPYMRSMDVLVNASSAEPFGIVVIEGMSQCVPVVAVGDAGARDIIEDGVSGVLVARADPMLLADGIEGLLIDAPRRDWIARQGRERFLERFTAAAMSTALESSLRALCQPLPSALLVEAS